MLTYYIALTDECVRNNAIRRHFVGPAKSPVSLAHGQKNLRYNIRNKPIGQYAFPRKLQENYLHLKRFVSLNPRDIKTIKLLLIASGRWLEQSLMVCLWASVRVHPKQYLCRSSGRGITFIKFFFLGPDTTPADGKQHGISGRCC